MMSDQNITPTLFEDNGKIFTNSRDLAAFFRKQHKNVIQKLESLECSDEFRRLNFQPSSYINEQNKQQPCYNITRDGFTFLVMGFTGKKAAAFKEAYIQQFNAMEEKLRQTIHQKPVIDFTNPAQMRQLLLDSMDQLVEYKEEIAELTPKADALNRIAVADGSMTVTDTAKALQVRPKDLFAYLSHNGWIYRRLGNKNWIGYQTKIQQGLLEHKIIEVSRSDGSNHISEQVRITPRGVTKLAEIMAKA